ncbi:hypothetical protein TRVL_09529 [Trypanosoma vivax]|nr:hypothetical protein TRVL_09529 [Trypanosoma vivax]
MRKSRRNRNQRPLQLVHVPRVHHADLEKKANCTRTKEKGAQLLLHSTVARRTRCGDDKLLQPSVNIEMIWKYNWRSSRHLPRINSAFACTKARKNSEQQNN